MKLPLLVVGQAACMNDIIAIVFDDENNLDIPAIGRLATNQPFARANIFGIRGRGIVDQGLGFLGEHAMLADVIFVPFVPDYERVVRVRR